MSAPSFRDIVPEDSVIVETDCPYLAPVPYRGRRNEPSYLPHVLEKLCEVRGWVVEEGAERIRHRPP
jgi:TatD DNase family protein